MATRRAPLFVAGDPSLISAGLAPDRHAIMQPLWESCANVRFYQGKVRRLVPQALINANGAATLKGRGLDQVQQSNGTRWLFSAWHNDAAPGNLPVYRWYGPAATLTHTFTGGAKDDTGTTFATAVDFQAWGNWELMNSGVGAIKRFALDTSVLDSLPNAPTDVVCILKKQNQLLAIGTGLTKRGVAWSDADDITLWAAAADNLAGSLTIEELATPIRAGCRLGQNIAVYTEDQMGLVYWVGQPFIFGQKVALDGIGATGKRAVCADGRLNYGMSRNGAWQTDGNEFRYIDFGILSDYFQNNVNWAQSSKIVVARNDVTRCIEYHFPAGSSLENNEAWSFEPSTGNWAPVTAFQAFQERILFSKPIAAASGETYRLDDNPATVGALSLITKPLLIDTPEYPGLHIDTRVDEIELAIKAASNVQFRYGTATDIDGPWQWTPQQALSPDLRTYRQPALPTGTFHKLEFSNTATNWDFDLQGFAFYGQVEGIKRDVS